MNPAANGVFPFYILRKPENVMVPLVPADQLPFPIEGIPQSLSHRQMSDEGWKMLHETFDPATVLQVGSPRLANSRLHTPPSHERVPSFRAPDHYIRSGSSTTPPRSSTNFPSQTTTTPPYTARLPTLRNSPQSLSDSLAAVYPQDAQRLGYRSSHPSGIQPDSSKKEYCHYWIKTGECSFQVQGCIFKHVMPPIDKLRELGFRAVPLWYKEKQTLDKQGPTWMQQRQQALKKKEEAQGSDSDDEARVSGISSSSSSDTLVDPSQARHPRLEAIFARARATNTSNPKTAPQKASSSTHKTEARLKRSDFSSQSENTTPTADIETLDLIDMTDEPQPVSPPAPPPSTASLKSTTSLDPSQPNTNAISKPRRLSTASTSSSSSSSSSTPPAKNTQTAPLSPQNIPHQTIALPNHHRHPSRHQTVSPAHHSSSSSSSSSDSDIPCARRTP